MTSQSRDMQDDDFSNPGFLWVDAGEELWGKVNGSNGSAKNPTKQLQIPSII